MYAYCILTPPSTNSCVDVVPYLCKFRGSSVVGVGVISACCESCRSGFTWVPKSTAVHQLATTLLQSYLLTHASSLSFPGIAIIRLEQCLLG